MKVVIDSNVLFRTMISQGEILQILFNPKLIIFAPEILREEILRNKNEILKKSALAEEDFDKLILMLLNRMIFIPLENYLPFMSQAKAMLGNHEKDAEFIALALLKNTKVWTYEARLFKAGIGISTKEISRELT